MRVGRFVGFVGILAGTFAAGAAFAVSSPSPSPGNTCRAGERVTAVVTVEYDKAEAPDVAGVVVSLDYPGKALTIPGAHSDQSVHDRVTNLATGHDAGIFECADRDAHKLGYEDQLRIGLADPQKPIASGRFARVAFDCVPGASRVDALPCSVELTTNTGKPVTTGRCRAAIEP